MKNVYCLHRKGGKQASYIGVCSWEFSWWVLSLQQARSLVGGCVICLDMAEVIISSSVCFDLFEFAAVNEYLNLHCSISSHSQAAFRILLIQIITNDNSFASSRKKYSLNISFLKSRISHLSTNPQFLSVFRRTESGYEEYSWWLDYLCLLLSYTKDPAS